MLGCLGGEYIHVLRHSGGCHFYRCHCGCGHGPCSRARVRHGERERRKGWAAFEKAVDSIFDPEETITRFHHHVIQDNVQKAESLALEADMEPRIWRTPFRTALFFEFTAMVLKLRYTVTVLEVTMARGYVDGGEKCPSFLFMTKSPAFGKIRKCLKGKIKQIGRLALLLEHEVEGPMKGETAPCLRDEPEMLSMEYIEDMEAAIAEAKYIDFSSIKGERLDLHDDPICKLSLVVSSCNAMVEVMIDMQHKLLNA